MSNNPVVVYSARPINTYRGPGKAVGDAYVAFVHSHFNTQCVVDPNSKHVSDVAAALVSFYSIDPKTGTFSQEYFDAVGSAGVMRFFTEAVVKQCTHGCGLALPMQPKAVTFEYAVGAGVAAELRAMYDLGRPTEIAFCQHEGGDTGFAFYTLPVARIIDDVGRGIDSVSKRPLNVFVVEYNDGLLVEVPQLSVEETRARMYTKNADGSWNRECMQPYFLD